MVGTGSKRVLCDLAHSWMVAGMAGGGTDGQTGALAWGHALMHQRMKMQMKVQTWSWS